MCFYCGHMNLLNVLVHTVLCEESIYLVIFSVVKGFITKAIMTESRFKPIAKIGFRPLSHPVYTTFADIALYVYIPARYVLCLILILGCCTLGYNRKSMFLCFYELVHFESIFQSITRFNHVHVHAYLTKTVLS